MSTATHPVTLARGLLLDGRPQTEAEIREATLGDILDASREAEVLVQGPDGPCLVASPALLGVAVLAKQIVRIGEIEGPLTLTELRRLSADDYDRLQLATEQLRAASLEVAARGRDGEADAGGETRRARGEPSSARVDA
ncbi:MAG: phage tail assembly protein [Gammaproteobacteria bacterium]